MKGLEARRRGVWDFEVELIQTRSSQEVKGVSNNTIQWGNRTTYNTYILSVPKGVKNITVSAGTGASTVYTVFEDGNGVKRAYQQSPASRDIVLPAKCYKIWIPFHKNYASKEYILDKIRNRYIFKRF